MPATDLSGVVTPIPLVHLEPLESNLATWADHVTTHEVALRPHAKTHRTVEVARRQLEHGAVGLTVAKPSEGRALLASGVTDLLVAYPIVGDGRVAAFLELAGKVHTSGCIDDLRAARALSEAASDAGLVVDVLVDVDTGLRRTGLPPEAAVELGVAAASLPGLHVAGVFSYAGYPSLHREEAARRSWAHQEAATAVEVAEALRERGLAAEVVSVGGTPTAREAAEVPGITEVRPGIYAFGDANTACLEVMSYDDVAFRVLATVVSRPAPDRAVIDAGTKALAADPSLDGETFGYLPAYPHAQLRRAWEEHGVLELGPDLAPGPLPDLGEQVEVIPNHVCPAVNLAAELLCVEDGRIVDRWEVVAR